MLDSVCRRVIVLEDCVVSARHEANIPVRMSDVGIPHPSDDWAIEPCQLISRVMTPRTLFNGSHNQPVALVCNYSDEPYELKADSYLARAEPVEHVAGEELPNHELACSDNANVSVLPDVSLSPDLQPTLELDPTTIFRMLTVSASPTANTAGLDSSPAMESPYSYGVSLCRTTSVKPHIGRHFMASRRLASSRTTASGVRDRIVLVVQRRTAPVCRVMVGLGF